MTVSKQVTSARRWAKRHALRGGAVVARSLLNREPVPCDLSRPPEGSGLQPVPGDKGLPILGHILEAGTLPVAFLESRRKNFGPVSWMRGFTFPLVLALGPEAAEEVFANNDKVFSQQGQESYSGPFFYRGLNNLDFEEHLDHRRIMQEAFSHERLSGYLHKMDTICRAAAAAVSGDELLLYPYLTNTVHDIETVTFLGEEPGPESSIVVKGIADCVHAVAAAIRFPVPGLRWHTGMRSRRALERHFHAKVHARRTSGGDDLFATLCHVRDRDGNQFTDEDVVNHIIYLMSAATHTTAAAAAAILYQLALHPVWQDRIRAESPARGPLDLEALDRMTSLEMVINESMRLMAPVPAVFRKALSDTSIQGHFVPAGSTVVVTPAFNHYWPGLWSDPYTFDPERFSDARREDRSHRLAFVPFGAGVHKCIGMRFATMVLKVLIHHLLYDRRIEMRSGYTLAWDTTALPAPADDFPVLIRRGNDSQKSVTAAT